jgi:hypothetical protein
VLTALCQFLAGCNHVPSQDILGSFFPSWMLCSAGGILFALVVRQIAIRTGIDAFVPARLIIYFGLAASVTFVLWLVWFGN